MSDRSYLVKIEQSKKSEQSQVSIIRQKDGEYWSLPIFVTRVTPTKQSDQKPSPATVLTRLSQKVKRLFSKR